MSTQNKEQSGCDPFACVCYLSDVCYTEVCSESFADRVKMYISHTHTNTVTTTYIKHPVSVSSPHRPGPHYPHTTLHWSVKGRWCANYTTMATTLA